MSIRNHCRYLSDVRLRIPEKDRNTLRFLWQIGGSVVEYRMMTHLFGGVWCASSSTIALRKIVGDVDDVYLCCIPNCTTSTCQPLF